MYVIIIVVIIAATPYLSFDNNQRTFHRVCGGRFLKTFY